MFGVLRVYLFLMETSTKILNYHLKGCMERGFQEIKRKESTFFAKPDDHKANLRLSPTTMHPDIAGSS